MNMYDPLGLGCPFTLWGKVYLRELWSLKLDWDTPLSAHLTTKWVKFFTTISQLEHLRYPRCLQPEDAIGRPWLIILSDGSDIAYGFAAYIRWRLENGKFWCRFVKAKCRIAPLNKISTPQMELNAAVLSKRGRRVIGSEMRLEFEKVLQLVDSETVLSMINLIKQVLASEYTKESELVEYKLLRMVTCAVGRGCRVSKTQRIGLHQGVNQIR